MLSVKISPRVWPSPTGAPHDEYAITLKYKNKQQEEVKDFTEENYPWQDTVNWEYVSSDQKLIKEGYKAPIHDFVIEHPESGDITQEVLEDNGYTFLVIAYNINKTDPENQEKLTDWQHMPKIKVTGFMV